LTQRTIGPVCTGVTALDVSNMKDGDVAGLALLQKNYGLIAVRATGTAKELVMVNASTGQPEEAQRIPLTQSTVYLKAECNFTDRKDIADFFYSIDGTNWIKFGTPLKMRYTLPHFMGYRFTLFNYATKETGGFVDFDYFRISDSISGK
jgi:beta-xylosidase